jgi:ketosteroid isomerase-like protein
VNETPVHPARSFVGQAQVRRNWEQIFAAVPDLRAEIVATAVAGADVWTEWEMQGTRRDGSEHSMRGVVVFSVGEGVATRARFYLEPVDATSGTVDDAVREQVVR